jgi:transposase-like protein
MSEPSNPLRLEVVGVLRNGRRRYDPASKRRLVEACLQPGVSLAGVAMQQGVNANLLRKWVAGQQRRQRNGVAVGAIGCATEVFVPVVESCAVWLVRRNSQLRLRSSTMCSRPRPRARRIRLHQG